MIGKTISHYEILEKLGSGGMGVVYKAQDTKLERFVALKFLPPHLSQAEEEKKRFIHEAKTASALNHPNIATIYEIDEADGQIFIAMEYIEGKSIEDMLVGANGRLPLPVDDAISHAIQIAEGLQAAHEKGIIHRDIKPANIIITEEGQAKIVDFGLAKLAGRTMLTKEGTTLGTVAYMSPEQTQGAHIDHRTDIWALGVMVYEMLAGDHPFKGDYEQAVMYSIMNENPEFITKVRSEVPTQMEKILEKALEKNPDKRFLTTDEMLMELQTVREKLKSGESKSRPRLLRIGRKQRANLYRTVAVFAVLIAAAGLYLRQTDHAEAKPVSIAILPMTSITDDSSQEWFTDGMTEALITDLAKIGGLRVVSRSSVMQYKGTTKPTKEIARELRVDYLIDGSVLKVEDQVKISARLIDPQEDQYLWADNYQREFRDVLTLHGEIAQIIAREVQVKLTPEEQTRLASARPVDPETYELYLRGRHHSSKGTADDIKKAVEYYNQALERDPDFGPAYTGLVESYLLQGFGELAPKEAFIKFQAYSQKAMELDDALGSDHHQLAMIKIFSDRDWHGAEKELIRAIELDPSSSSVYDSYCQFLWAMGRTDESVTAGEKAVELDPVSHFVHCDLGWAYYYADEQDQAIKQLRKTTELFGSDCPYHYWLKIRLMIEQADKQRGTYEHVIADLEKRLETMPEDHVRILSFLGSAYALSGETDQARKIIRELQQLATKEFVDPCHLAAIHISLGEYDEALRLLEQAYEQGSFLLLYTIKSSPWYDPLRDDPRFQDLLRRMGLAETKL
ncbi:MAG: protein kinase [bacterium]